MIIPHLPLYWISLYPTKTIDYDLAYCSEFKARSHGDTLGWDGQNRQERTESLEPRPLLTSARQWRACSVHRSPASPVRPGPNSIKREVYLSSERRTHHLHLSSLLTTVRPSCYFAIVQSPTSPTSERDVLHSKSRLLTTLSPLSFIAWQPSVQ